MDQVRWATLHTINGGAFAINITAPPINNEYTYTFRLVDLPDENLQRPLRFVTETVLMVAVHYSRLKVDAKSTRN